MLDVTMAKPQTDKKTEAAASFPAGVNYLAPPTYGFAGNPYGSLGAGYGVASGYQQVCYKLCIFLSCRKHNFLMLV